MLAATLLLGIQMALIGGGEYRPLFPPNGKETTVAVAPFRLDKTPVTNGEFLAFVREHPEWRRDRIAPVFAEAAYLAHWSAPDALGPDVDQRQPVVDVSWFAARAYCASQSKRLPTEAEWERAAAASRTRPDGAAEPAWRAEVLSLYSRALPDRLPRVGAGKPNFWGVYDLHGVVWEWVSDFSSAATAFANGSDRLRFCGASGASASDATDFAAFERAAFRSSLHANYTVRSLGFRCAADAPEGTGR
jgi:formylglycine-generating enzyme required for sulfatase activity